MAPKIMKQAGTAFFWTYRKEALSLAGLFLLGMGFGATWIFYDNNFENPPKTEMSLAFEEDHNIIEVEIADTTSSNIPKDLGYPSETKENAPPDIVETWKLNAVQVTGHVADKPQVTIVIDDLGVVKNLTLGVIDLKGPLTLSFLPYGKNLREITQLAAGNGHELMVHLPMEPQGDKNPGPHALRVAATDGKNLEDLYFNLSQFEGYVGLNNHMGSAFTEDRAGLSVMLDEVKRRGLLVLDSRTSRKSLLADLSSDKNIPNMTRDFFLDNIQDVDYILGQLFKLEEMAKKRGHAIAIGHPYKETIEALTLWRPTLKEKGIVLVPLSHIMKKKYDKILLAKGKKRE
ncbi:MAG: divergent polysaccharide deacetylase family protein [Emcibacter sp.]|nr:divergent polysaccharide deacetylase family protein [Emcibacter sp.]